MTPICHPSYCQAILLGDLGDLPAAYYSQLLNTLQLQFDINHGACLSVNLRPRSL